MTTPSFVQPPAALSGRLATSAQSTAAVRDPGVATWSENTGSGSPVEDRLARLAAAVGPLRRVFAALAERLVGGKGYERLCYARLSDYARERLGISARQLQELARVHRALAQLPLLERALVANELPWSKVRLIARVATEADEGEWIARARGKPTRWLEREVREHSPVAEAETGDTDSALAQQQVTLRCTPAVREKWVLAREIAERVAGQRLRAGDALEWVTAEAFSSLSIDPELIEEADEGPRSWQRGAPESSQGGSPVSGDAAASRVDAEARGDAETLDEAESPPAPRALARELPLEVASLSAGLAEANPFELDRRLRYAVRLEQTLDAAIAPLLRCVTSSEYEWRVRYQTLSGYARDQLGMSASKARALLRLERAADVCAQLRDATRSGRLSWVKAQLLAPLLRLELEGEWRPVWVAWAERVTVRRLEQDVERALLLRAGHDLAWHRCKFHPERAQDMILLAERQMCAPDVDVEATQQLSWRVPRGVASLFFAVSEALRSELQPADPARYPTYTNVYPTNGQVFEALLDCALRAWLQRDPAARRPDPVIERDGYRCAVPGCTSRRNLHDHHLEFRSAGGSDALSNRVTLCAFHHQRCLHAGLLRVTGRAPHELRFELGLRPGCPPLARYRSGDIAVAEPGVEVCAGSESWFGSEDWFGVKVAGQAEVRV